jgi:hypothetical protein
MPRKGVFVKPKQKPFKMRERTGIGVNNPNIKKLKLSADQLKAFGKKFKRTRI